MGILITLTVLYVLFSPTTKGIVSETQVQLQFKQILDNVSGGRVRTKEGSSLSLLAKRKVKRF